MTGIKCWNAKIQIKKRVKVKNGKKIVVGKIS